MADNPIRAVINRENQKARESLSGRESDTQRIATKVYRDPDVQRYISKHRGEGARARRGRRGRR